MKRGRKQAEQQAAFALKQAALLSAWSAEPQPCWSRIYVPAHFQPACCGKFPQAAVSTFPLWCLLFCYLGNWNP